MSTQKNYPQSWAAYPQVAQFWDKFDQAYLAEFADKLVAIGQYDLGFRLPGTESGRQAADFIAEQMRRVGLQEVRQEPFPVHGWDFKGAHLEISTPQARTLRASSYAASVGTPPEGLSASLVAVGGGTAADYEGLDVRGKIVFVGMDFDQMPWMGAVVYEAELHGAAGVVITYLNRVAQHESGEALNCQDGNLRQTIPVIHLCQNDGQWLAALIEAEPVEVTLHCRAANQPDATGHNVLGIIPGRSPDRYLLLQAHYDSWFYGYWDNTIGLAGILTIAKALIEIGYQPEHTLIVVSPDAEEFGAPDTPYGWLYGCHRLIESHPEWIGRMTCALNIDTLAHRWQRGVQFIGPAEMIPFLRQVVHGYRVEHFPLDTVAAVEQITPWTEVFNYAYFGIPPIQPRFKTENDAARVSVYHTQFDEASIVDLDGAAEILKLYGTILIHLDQQVVSPYNFVERARAIRASLDYHTAQRAEVDLMAFEATLDEFQEWAGQLDARIESLNRQETPLAAPEATALSDRLRQMIRPLLPASYFTEGDYPDVGQYEHLFWARELLALDKAIAYLLQGNATAAIEALTDAEAGVQGGWYALNVSYPVYYRCTIDGRNPARDDLLWGRERTIPLTDVWMDLHKLADKAQQAAPDFAPEIHSLRAKRRSAATGYRDALARLQQVLVEVMRERPKFSKSRIAE